MESSRPSDTGSSPLKNFIIKEVIRGNMKGFERVKVLTFEGKDAKSRCQKTVNEGIEKGWQPIDFSTYVPPQASTPTIMVLMGKEGTTEEYIEEQISEEEIGELQEMEEEESEPGLQEEVIEEEIQEDIETPIETPEEETVEERTEEMPGDEDISYQKCPQCGNVALLVNDDLSAHCEYCGYFTQDIEEEEGEEEEVTEF